MTPIDPDETLRKLADKQALGELVAAYSRAIDRRDFALLRSLYHDDAIDDHGTMFCGPVDAYVAWVAETLTRFEATAHYAVQSLFVVDGDCAEGETYKINYHRTPAPDAQEIVTGSRSLDRFERRGGVWRFTLRSVTLDWSEVRPVDPAAYAQFAAGSVHGRPDGSDPSYARLRLFPRFPALTPPPPTGP